LRAGAVEMATVISGLVLRCFTVKACLCALSERSIRSFFSLFASPFLWRPLIFCMPGLVRLSLISFLKSNLFHLISESMGYFLAGKDQQ